MNFKTLLLGLLLALYTGVGTAQDYKERIREEFSEYLTAMKNGEYEKSTDYILPGLFEITPRAKMVSIMEQTFNNREVEFQIKDPIIHELQDAEQDGEKKYVLFTYTNRMNIRFLLEDADQELTRILIERQYGSDNVNYNEETDFFEIRAVQPVYAVAIDGQENWKFLEFDKNQRELMKKLLPAQLVEKL